MKKEESQRSSVSLRPQYNKSGQSVPMVKNPLGSDNAYNYKRIGKITYVIHHNQTIIPYHSGLYPRIKFVLGAYPKLIKDMFEYGF